jgi:hypothetical protein
LSKYPTPGPKPDYGDDFTPTAALTTTSNPSTINDIESEPTTPKPTTAPTSSPTTQPPPIPTSKPTTSQTTPPSTGCSSGSCDPEQANCVMAAGGGGITPDGLILDWDTTDGSPDFLHDMREAGKFDMNNGDFTMDLASKAYARYDCTTNKLCILVKAEPDITISSGNTWFKIYDISTDEQAYFDDTTLHYLAPVAAGATGCVTAGTYDEIEIHANYGGGTQTTSTGRGDYDLSLQLGCCGGTSTRKLISIEELHKKEALEADATIEILDYYNILGKLISMEELHKKEALEADATLDILLITTTFLIPSK